MHANGRGVAKDDTQAVAWFRKAADQGYATAQYYLGIMYADGRGVAKDDAQAISWFHKAADQGLASAQTSLHAVGGVEYLVDHHEKGDQSCHVEPSFRLLHPLSLASGALRLFQLTPLYIGLASVVLALLALAFITEVSTVVQPYAVERRWASELLPSELP